MGLLKALFNSDNPNDFAMKAATAVGNPLMYGTAYLMDKYVYSYGKAKQETTVLASAQYQPKGGLGVSLFKSSSVPTVITVEQAGGNYWDYVAAANAQALLDAAAADKEFQYYQNDLTYAQLLKIQTAMDELKNAQTAAELKAAQANLKSVESQNADLVKLVPASGALNVAWTDAKGNTSVKAAEVVGNTGFIYAGRGSKPSKADLDREMARFVNEYYAKHTISLGTFNSAKAQYEKDLKTYGYA